MLFRTFATGTLLLIATFFLYQFWKTNDRRHLLMVGSLLFGTLLATGSWLDFQYPNLGLSLPAQFTVAILVPLVVTGLLALRRKA